MSIQEVARRAGVSVATVSRVFNLPDKVAPETRALVEQAAQDTGYLPNASARTLRTQRSRALGVVLPTLVNPVFAECLQGIASAASAAGYAIVPLTTDYRLAHEEQAVARLLAGNVDGMILVVSDCRPWATPMCCATTATRPTPACRWTASRPWRPWWADWCSKGTGTSPWSAASAPPPTAPSSAAAAMPPACGPPA